MPMKTKPITLIIAAAFFALLAPMQADDKDKSNHTITLVCDTGSRHAATPTTIDLNEAEGVVTTHGGAMHNPGGSPNILPGTSSAPLKARFTKNTITFAWHAGSRVDDFTINRL